MQLAINIILSTSIYLLLSLSFSIIYCSSKSLYLSHAIYVTCGAYFCYYFLVTLSLSLVVAVPASIFFVVLLGLFIESNIYKRFRKNLVSSLLQMIASLGIYICLQNFISILWGDNMRSIQLGSIKVGIEVLRGYITQPQIAIIIVCITLFVVVALFKKYNRIGRNINAISSNPVLAEIFGINIDKSILWATGIGSGLAAISGILVAFDTGLTPTMGFNLLLYGMVTMILGGIRSTWGLICGAVLLATLQHLTAYYIDSKWMDAITYFTLIIFLLWKPLGFSGKRLKKVEI